MFTKELLAVDKYTAYSDVVIVSSDLDFVFLMKKLLSKGKTVTSISQHNTNRKLLLLAPITNKQTNLKSNFPKRISKFPLKSIDNKDKFPYNSHPQTETL